MRRTLHIILILSFLAAPVDPALLEGALAGARDTLAPSSRLNPLAKLIYDPRTNTYSAITDAEALSSDRNFKDMATTLYSNTLAVATIGEGLYLRLGSEAIKELLDHRAGSEAAASVESADSGTVHFTISGARYRAFLPGKDDPHNSAMPIALRDGRVFMLEKAQDGKARHRTPWRARRTAAEEDPEAIRTNEWGNLENAIKSVYETVRQERPDIIERYERLDRMSFPARKMLEDDIYEITAGHIQAWGLSFVTHEKLCPYFGGRHSSALMAAFPKLGLVRYGFGIDYSSRDSAIGSARFMIRREVPHLMERYDRVLTMPPDQARVLKDDICSIHSGHIQAWGLSGLLSKKNAPWLEGSYYNILTAVFDDPALGLSAEYIANFRKAHHQIRYSWIDGEPQAIANVTDAFGKDRPDLIKRYSGIDRMDEAAKGLLRRDIARLSSGHLKSWGLNACYHNIYDGIYPNIRSHAELLMAVFPRLGLNRMDFEWDWSNREAACESVRYALRKNAPAIMEMYNKFDLLSDGDARILRARIYRLTAGHFGAWGLYGALKKETTPYFKGSHIDALIMALPKLGLEKKGFYKDKVLAPPAMTSKPDAAPKPAVPPKTERPRLPREPKPRMKKTASPSTIEHIEKIKTALSVWYRTMSELIPIVGLKDAMIRKHLKSDDLREWRENLVSTRDKRAIERRFFIEFLLLLAPRTALELAERCGVKPYIIWNDFKSGILKPYKDRLINAKKKAALDRRARIRGFLTAARLTVDELAGLSGVSVATAWNDLKSETLRSFQGRIIPKYELKVMVRHASIRKLLAAERMTLDGLAGELGCARQTVAKDLAREEFSGLRKRIISKQEAKETEVISRIKAELDRKEQSVAELAAAVGVSRPTIVKYAERPELAGVRKRIVEPVKESKVPVIRERLEKGPATLAELSGLSGLKEHTVSDYVSGEKELETLKDRLISAADARISSRRQRIRELVEEGLSDIDEIAGKLGVSASLVRADLRTEELKDQKARLDARSTEADKFVAWYFSGDGLRNGDLVMLKADASSGIKVVRHGRLANFYFSVPDKEGDIIVALAAEDDPNHGQVVNVYGTDSSGDADRSKPIATFKHFKRSGTAERFYPARSDILGVHFGWGGIKTINRHIDARINSSGYIWISARRPGDGIVTGHHFSVPVEKVRDMALNRKRVVGMVEDDPNHGQVINFYLASDYYASKKSGRMEPLATYKYYEGIRSPKGDMVSSVRVDLGALDVIKAYNGEKLSLCGRTAAAAVNKGNYGAGVCYITMLLKTEHEVRIQFGIPRRYMRKGALGKRVVMRPEEAVNSGQIINIFMEDEFESRKDPEPVATYKYFPEEVRHYATGDKKGICKPVDLSVEDLVAYYGGAKDLKAVAGRAAVLPVMGSGSGIRAEMKKARKERTVFFLSPEAAQIYGKIKKSGWRIAASLKEDPDYGMYIDLSRGGKQLGTYRYFPEFGRCTVANFGRMALMDYALGNKNPRGEAIAPRAYLYSGVVNSRYHTVSIRHGGSEHIVSRLGTLGGRAPLFVPVKDDIHGYVINVYDAEEYNSNKKASPKVRLIRYPYFRKLIPIDTIELSRAKEFFEKRFLLKARSAITKFLSEHPRDVEGKMIAGQIESSLAAAVPAAEGIKRLDEEASAKSYVMSLADAISSGEEAMAGALLGRAKAIIAQDPQSVPRITEEMTGMFDFESGAESSAYVNMAVFRTLAAFPDEGKTVRLARSASRVTEYEGPEKERLREDAMRFFSSYPRASLFRQSEESAVDQAEEMSEGVRLDEPMSQYIRDITAHPLLTDAGEAVLSSLAHLGDDEAAKDMAASNLKYVISIVRHYIRPGMSVYDLVGAGNEGLLKAVEKFDPSLGFRFSTYATWWIRQAAGRYIQNNYRQIRIPVNKQAEIKHFKKECAALGLDPYDYKVSDSKIADVLGVDESEVRSMREMMAGVVSMNSPYSEEDADGGPESTLEGSIGSPDEAFERSERKDMVDSISREVELRIAESSGSPERDIGIFKRRILPLFMMERPDTLEEVGLACGITRERVRQIERKIISRHVHRALKKLKLTKRHLVGDYDMPSGSIYSVFRYILAAGAGGKAVYAAEVAGACGAYDTIKHDLRALYYHLRLIKRESGAGRNARYYVPENVRKKLEDRSVRHDIFNVLARFRKDGLRPDRSALSAAYDNEISPILREARVPAAPVAAQCRRLIDEVKKAAYFEKARDNDSGMSIIIAVEIPESAHGYLQPLICKIKYVVDAAVRRGVIGNGISVRVSVVYGSKDSLKSNIVEEADRINAPARNVVVLGTEETLLRSGRFDDLKGKAFIACFDPEKLPDYVGMMEASIEMAFGKKPREVIEKELSIIVEELISIGRRIVRMTPSRPIDPAEQERLYRLQTRQFAEQA